jgi:hypothetical protein
VLLEHLDGGGHALVLGDRPEHGALLALRHLPQVVVRPLFVHASSSASRTTPSPFGPVPGRFGRRTNPCVVSGRGDDRQRLVAREYGVPAVSGVPAVTSRVRTGDRVTVDGGADVVTVERSE